MKKLFIVLGISLVIAACGGSKSGQSDSDSTATKKDSTTAGSGSTASGADLIAKSDCSTCHKTDVKLIGPAFVDVAAKYKDKGDAIVDTLANKIMKGGSGNWGTTPMASHPAISIGDARTIAKYILTLKK